MICIARLHGAPFPQKFNIFKISISHIKLCRLNSLYNYISFTPRIGVKMDNIGLLLLLSPSQGVKIGILNTIGNFVKTLHVNVKYIDANIKYRFEMIADIPVKS